MLYLAITPGSNRTRQICNKGFNYFLDFLDVLDVLIFVTYFDFLGVWDLHDVFHGSDLFAFFLAF